MKPHLQLYLPDAAPDDLSFELTIHASSSGLGVVGWWVRETGSGAEIGGGVGPARAWQEVESEALDLLRHFLRELPSLVDAPPFD